MKHLRNLVLLGAALLTLGTARADDIDIFLSRTSSTGGGGKPNVLFMVDNSANWARQAQQWPDNGGTQGAAEIAAIRSTVGTTAALGMNIGLAGYTQSGGGGYIRFGVRDMAVDANRTALQNMLGYIGSNINASSEKVNDSYETAAMFEAYRYFTGGRVFRGAKSGSNDPVKNVDISGNTGAAAGATAFGQGLTSGGYAYVPSALPNYTAPSTITGCTTNVLIMVINNAQGTIPTGQQSYDGTSAGNALAQPDGVTSTSWTDEWARFLNSQGITVYILDAYNAQQNLSHSRTLAQAASVGGGKYYAVKNQAEIEIALGKVLAEINANDSTFAAAALPVSASNRSQYLNQVFIGMFRPDPNANPRWLGNLKQYKLGLTDGGGVELRDSLNANAINPLTGFVYECAVSDWTTDSATFWTGVKDSSLGVSACTTFPTVGGVTGNAKSDMPDGPSVAKGGIAEVIRKGNNPPTTNTTPSAWAPTNRNLLTYNAAVTDKLSALTTTLTGWTSDLLDWVSGKDDQTEVGGVRINSEYLSASVSARVRPSVHGDVIHSKPLAVNYGGATGVTVFYGANDGMFRAVDTTSGRERWAFVAPEHYARYARLKDNTPSVAFPGFVTTPTPTRKDYFFDGSTGLYQNADNSKVWIYPSQRRGGRMVYGFDVTNPNAPKLKWRVGCPNLTDDTGCTTGMVNVGQTWSQPTVALIKGYPTSGAETPVVILGGGYDGCEDADNSSPSCGSRKGNVIYVLDGFTGSVIRSFSVDGSVAADIALADRNGDGFVDFAYAATTSGSVYRVNFTNSGYGALAYASWANRKIGYTDGAGRKFLNTPALMPSGDKMYVALGTGDREKPLIGQYPYTTPVANRFYVVLDNVADPASMPAAVNMDDSSVMKDYSGETSCTTEGVTPMSTWKGWFMDLTYRGEQTTTSAVAIGGMVTFSTNRPLSGSMSMCAATANLGEARGYWLNILNASGGINVGNATCGGDRSGLFPPVGLVPSPTVVTVNIDGIVRTVTLGAIQRSGGASSGIGPQPIRPPIKAKRRTIYWRNQGAE